jgi:hypothetical protein
MKLFLQKAQIIAKSTNNVSHCTLRSMASVRLNGASAPEGWEAARINVLRSLDEVSFVPGPVGCLTAFYEFDDVLVLLT